MRRWLIVRRTVQVVALLIFAAPLLAAGWSLFGLTQGGEDAVAVPASLPFFGTLSSSTIAEVVLFDPFAVLEVIAASRSVELGWVLGAAGVLAFYTLIGARAFCGWVCPVNLLLELVDWLRQKLRLRVVERALPRHTKRFVAAGFLVLAFLTARPLFENLSPIAAVSKGILFGGLAGITVLLAIILAELLWARRVWCRALCPVGAVYELIGSVGLVKPRIDHASCTGCQRCKQVCLASPEILDPALNGVTSRVKAGDCLRCGACADECPENAIKLRIL